MKLKIATRTQPATTAEDAKYIFLATPAHSPNILRWSQKNLQGQRMQQDVNSRGWFVTFCPT